ncbi:MAG: SGNH/GDSL hydrolase family protein [Kiritimatiellia bacterium]
MGMNSGFISIAVLATALCAKAECPWVGELPAAFKSGAAVPALEVTGPRAQLVAGDWSRFEQVFARLDRGEAIRIAVIGGSITQGAGASTRENQWGSRFVAGWRRMFPKCAIEFVNAGIGATGSDIGAFRLARDVLAKKPDVVAVEFSVNDAPCRERAASYEGVIRQLLKDPGNIAVILLGMVGQTGNNAQEWHGQVARHYRVPYVSYRDALYYPYVKAGEVKWTDISPDTIHPNDDGHAYAAALVNWTVAGRYRAFKAARRAPSAMPPMPGPLYGTRYDGGRFCLMQDAKIVENTGFFPLKDDCWGVGLACTNANGRLVFEVEGSTVALLYRLGNKPYNWGKIAVKIDGTSVVDGLDCFRDQWWWYTPSLFLCRDRPGRHVVEVETRDAKNPNSAGYGCHLTGILVSERK